VGRLNFELYRANVPCKKLRVWRRRYHIWEV
jgi:hypothetical protein